MNITVENLSRIMSKLRLGFTNDSARRLAFSKLKRVPRPNNRYNTSSNFLICVKSLEDYLLKEVGLEANVIYQAIYGGEDNN